MIKKEGHPIKGTEYLEYLKKQLSDTHVYYESSLKLLMANLESERSRREIAQEQVHALTQELATYHVHVAIEIKNLREERDEARRWVCQAGLFSLKMAKEVAIRRGWDCYKKEETP